MTPEVQTPQELVVKKTILRQEKERNGTTTTSLYWRVHNETTSPENMGFRLHPYDIATGRIFGIALYFHHEAGASVMVYSPSTNKEYDLVKIVGNSNARAEARKDVEALAKKVGIPVVEVPENEWRTYFT